MDQNSFFLDIIEHEMIKFGLTYTIRTIFLVMPSFQKLPRPAFIKSYVNNVSLCKAYVFLEGEISIGGKFFKFFVHSIT